MIKADLEGGLTWYLGPLFQRSSHSDGYKLIIDDHVPMAPKHFIVCVEPFLVGIITKMLVPPEFLLFNPIPSQEYQDMNLY